MKRDRQFVSLCAGRIGRGPGYEVEQARESGERGADLFELPLVRPFRRVPLPPVGSMWVKTLARLGIAGLKVALQTPSPTMPSSRGRLSAISKCNSMVQRPSSSNTRMSWRASIRGVGPPTPVVARSSSRLGPAPHAPQVGHGKLCPNGGLGRSRIS